MTNNLNRECAYCGRRAVLTMRLDRADALADFAEHRNWARPACPECGDENTELVVRDSLNRVVATTDMFSPAYVEYARSRA